jgi:glycosyltransferase involved in cell wall biosynthesis
MLLWPLAHWLKLKRIPFAFWTKGGNWDHRNSRSRYYLFNYLHALSDGLILYASSCKELIDARFHGKSFVANNTLNLFAFPAIAETKDDIKRQLGLTFKKVVLFVGNMAAGNGRKKVDHLIELFRLLDREDVGLVLVGAGLSNELQQRLNRRNTVYLGDIHDPEDTEISRVFKMADICAIPGHVGLGLNQALYWGLPVVTEEGDHPPEIGYLRPGRNGFLVPKGDLAAFADSMLYLLDNDEVRAEFSRNAAEDILRDASPERMFEGFRDCVIQLAGENARFA